MIYSKKRAVAVAAGLSIAALALSACGSSDGGGESGATTLTMWARAATEAQSKAFVDMYNASHETQVELTIIPNDDYQTKVGAAAGSSALPDLLVSDVVYLPNYTSAGIFADITDRIADLPFADDLAPAHIAAGTWEGKEYAAPHVMDLSVLFYNKDIYEKAGLDPDAPPTTLAELATQAEKISAAGIPDVSGTYFGGNCAGCLAFTWWPSIWAAGGDVLNSDGSAAELDSPEAAAVFSLYRSMVESGAVAPGAAEETGATWVALFPDGKVGVMPMPSNTLRNMPETTGVAPIPGPDGGESTFVGGDAIGISASSKNQDAAWEFIEWTLSDDAQLEVLAKGADVVARTDLAENDYTKDDPRLITINEVAGKGHTPLARNYGAAINDANGPWIALVRDQVFGPGGDLAKLNAAITAALAG